MSSESESDATPLAMLANASSASVQPERKRRRRPRATYHVRKDEIKMLQVRMQELELELQALKFQALVHGNAGSSRGNDDVSAADTDSLSSPLTASAGSTASPATPSSVSSSAMPPTVSPAEAAAHTRALAPAAADDSASLQPSAAKVLFTHRLLHDAIQTQQLALAGLQAMLSKYSSLQDTSPMHLPISLPTSAADRNAVLETVRLRAVALGKRFIAERSLGVDRTRAFAEQERFESLHGSFVVVNFDVLPLPAPASVFSVKCAHDAFCFQVRNVEITFSEYVGHITIRENDESLDPNVSQHRLVASTSAFSGHVETNVVTFAEYSAADNVGVLVVDSVDSDALFPYRPTERVRRDTSGIFEFQCVDDRVVVTRWSHTLLHASDLLQRDRRAEQSVRASLGAWGDKLLREVFDAAARAAVEAEAAAATAAATVAGVSGVGSQTDSELIVV